MNFSRVEWLHEVIEAKYRKRHSSPEFGGAGYAEMRFQDSSRYEIADIVESASGDARRSASPAILARIAVRIDENPRSRASRKIAVPSISTKKSVHGPRPRRIIQAAINLDRGAGAGVAISLRHGFKTEPGHSQIPNRTSRMSRITYFSSAWSMRSYSDFRMYPRTSTPGLNSTYSGNNGTNSSRSPGG